MESAVVTRFELDHGLFSLQWSHDDLVIPAACWQTLSRNLFHSRFIPSSRSTLNQKILTFTVEMGFKRIQSNVALFDIRSSPIPFSLHGQTPAWPRPLPHLLSPRLRPSDPTALSLTWFLFALISSEKLAHVHPNSAFQSAQQSQKLVLVQEKKKIWSDWMKFQEASAWKEGCFPWSCFLTLLILLFSSGHVILRTPS